MEYGLDEGAIERIKEATFLVTGAAGFIGSNLCEALLKLGAKGVVGLDNFLTGKKENISGFLSEGAFEFIEGDIRDQETCRRACQGVDYVLHQAALGSVPRSLDDPFTTDRVNVQGTLNLLVAAKEAGVKRFVYASSSSVYGDTPVLPKREEMTPLPKSPYAVSKLAGELYSNVFYSAFGLQTISLRYFNVYGKRQDPHSLYAAVIPRFISALLGGKRAVIYGDGEQTRDFTFVEDVVQANLRACFAPQQALGRAYNIAYGRRTSVNELYAIISSLLDLSPPPQPLREPPRKGDVRDSLADISSAQALLGYRPHYPLEEGLRRTLEWYRETLRAVPAGSPPGGP